MKRNEIIQLIIRAAEKAQQEMMSQSGIRKENCLNGDLFISALKEEMEEEPCPHNAACNGYGNKIGKGTCA